MRKRYSITLTGTFTASAVNTNSIAFDLRTLIPESCRGKHLMLYSSFDTTNLLATEHAGITVEINLPQSFNKQFPINSQNVLIGIGDPLFCDTNQNEMKYMYNENNCFIKMFEYPEVFPLKITLSSRMGLAFEAGAGWILNLTFEEIGNY